MKKQVDELAYLKPYIDMIKSVTSEEYNNDDIAFILLSLLKSTFEVATQSNGRAEDYLWGKSNKLGRQIDQLTDKNG